MHARVSRWYGVLCLLTLCVAGPACAEGELLHRYSFQDGTARDSVGHADGRIVGPLQIEGGEARFDGAAGERIELPASGPDGININTYRALTLEAWFTRQGGKGFQRLFDFGGSVRSPTGGSVGSHYVFFTPYTSYLGADGGRMARAALSQEGPNEETTAFTGAVSNGILSHVALVIDDKTMTLYVDGAPVSRTDLEQRRLSGLSNDQALLGGSLFSSDPTFSGSIKEFRVYSVAARADEIKASFKAGPHTVVIGQAMSVATPATTPPQPTLKILASHVMGIVSPLHAGLMTEEINHSYDGGLYGELVANRVLTDPYGPADFNPPNWSQVPDDTVIRHDLAVPFSDELDSSLRIEAKSAASGHRIGAANDGFWGFPVRPGTSYHYSFFARTSPGFAGPLSVTLESSDGLTRYATAKVPTHGEGWQQYEGTLTTDSNAPVTTKARLVISTETIGTFWLDLVSLFPPTFNHRENGNRIDLMQRLAAMRPSFLRFPGGNYLEGNAIANRFEWKKTLGPLKHRPTHMGPWGYRSSDGMGLYEFLLWCEELHMQPVLGVYAGNSLSRTEFVKPGAGLEPYVQDALDEIEYITGGADTPWGKRRAEAGHPAPFKLTYVEVGNEDWNPASDYDGRFAQFFDALKAKYPKMQLIATADVHSRTPDVRDDHFYRKAPDFYKDVHHYDHADRKGPKIFVGEWATTEGQPTPTFNAALGDAAWMTGMERNADIVIMQAYAPLLANVNTNPPGWQWATNLIGYDALTSFGSPSYYAQVMFNANRGDEVVESSNIAQGIYSSVTRDSRSGTLYIKVVNSTETDKPVALDIEGIRSVNPKGTLTVLTGHPEDTNSLSQPEKIHPIQSRLSGVSKQFHHTFPARSISVLRISAR